MNRNDIAFSVLMTAFNHEKFIEQAVRSVLDQQFNNRLQLVIGVDKSRDNTLAVCRRLQDENPERIELIVHESNVGMFQNYRAVLRQCGGKYIALLEGDDYWTDKNKLQKQFDYFEQHANCLLSAGRTDVIDDSDNQFLQKAKLPSKPEYLWLDDLVTANRLPTLTVAFRSASLRQDQFEKLSGAPHLDWGFYLSFNYQPDSYICLFNQCFGVYRQHHGGVYSKVGMIKQQQNVIKTLDAIVGLDLPTKYIAYLRSFRNSMIQNLADKSGFESRRSDLYDEDYRIYRESGNLKPGYLRRLYEAAFLFLFNKRRHRESLKLRWELFKQTKRSRRSYFSLAVAPVLPVMFFFENWDRGYKRREVCKQQSQQAP